MHNPYGANDAFNQQPGFGAKIEVVRVQLGKSGVYHPQYQRPFQTHVSASALNSIQEAVRIVGGQAGSMTPGLLAEHAFSFLKPQTAPEAEAGIVNGWGFERFYFFMEIRITGNTLEGNKTEFLQGYTDSTNIINEFLTNPQLDRNMVFQVNSVTEAKQHTYGTPQGVYNGLSVKAAYHVLGNNYSHDIRGLGNPTPAPVQSLRPHDIQLMASHSFLGAGADLVDSRTLITTMPKTSYRKNALASSYASSILSSVSAVHGDGSVYEAGPGMWTQASAKNAELPLARSAFFKFMSSANCGPLTTQFTWGDLLRLDPTLGHPGTDRVLVFRSGAPMVQNAMQNNGSDLTSLPHNAVAYTNHWKGTDYTTHAASIISNSLPGLLISAGLTSVDFLVTNNTYGAEVVWQFAGLGGLGGVDLTHRVEPFKAAVLMNIINPISYNGQLQYSIRVRCDLQYSTNMSIKIGDEPETPFISPTFADALTSPVVTGDASRAGAMSEDFITMTDHVLGSSRYDVDLAMVRNSSGGDPFGGGYTSSAGFAI